MNDRGPAPLHLGTQLRESVLEPLKRSFVGKDEIIDLLGLCIVAGENLFVLGPPGTAKSAIVHELGRRLDGPTFEYLLTRFTEPNELFGPFDIRKLREGELVTNTAGMLPEATLVFLDELLNANSAILNSLLTVLNERVLRRGRERFELPTLTVVGASNRLPEDETLGALFDRFLVRVHCENVDPERLEQVLDAGWQLELDRRPPPTGLGVEELRALHRLLPRVGLTAIRPAYAELVARLRQAGVPLSDRRAVKLQRLIAASALICGRLDAMVSDLWVLRYTWDTEEQIAVIDSLVTDQLQGSTDVDLSHPRAAHTDRPDPEALARDLEHLEGRVSGELSGRERVILRDRLALLEGRCEWVESEAPRVDLLGRIDRLWSRLGGGDRW